MIETFKSFLSQSSEILITTHKSPDGDAVGSAVACYEFMKACGKLPLILFPDTPAKNLISFLDGVEYSIYEEGFDVSSFELVFCLDYNHKFRVGEEMSNIFESNRISRPRRSR